MPGMKPDMDNTATPAEPAGPVRLEAEENLGSVLDASVVYQLRKFRHDNTPYGLRRMSGCEDEPTMEDGPASDREVYDLLRFAAGTIGPRPDYTLPRTLEALRLVNLVPEDIGAAIFAKIDGPY